MKRFMQYQFLGRGIGAALAVALSLSAAVGQNIVVSGSGSFANTGTIKVKGNINTSAASAAVTIGGTVELNGTTQDLGVGGQSLVFTTLNVLGTDTKTMTANVSVSDALTVNNTSGKFLDVNNKVLTVGGTSTLSGGASLDVTDASSEVTFNRIGGSQTVLGLVYAGKLTLQNSSTKDLSGNASVTDAFSHTGGGITINHDLTVAGASSFAVIADVTGNSTLAFSGTGAKTITTVDGIANGSAISNTGASGLLTVSTLNGNSGAINSGAGGVTFTNAATNGGTITGSGGPVTFGNTLGNGGSITAGSGGIAFIGTVTRNLGNSISSSAGLLNFNGDVSGTNGTIALTGTGSAEFAGALSATGLSFASGTSVIYDGVAPGQAIADVDYGYLTLKNSTKAWTLGAARAINNDLDLQASSATTIGGSFDLNVSGNITLASNLTKSANAVIFANAASTVSSGALTYDIVGAVTRTHTFAAATSYTLNNSATKVQINSAPVGMTFTLNSQPGTNPTGYSIGHSVNRTFTANSTGFTSGTANVTLGYLQGESVTLGVTETKLKDFRGGIVSGNKVSGTPSRTASGASAFGSVAYTGLANTLFSGSSELALDDRFNLFKSIGVGNWNIAGTWDANDVPGSTDDVEIAGAFAVTIPAGLSASAYSVLVDNGTTTDGGLTVAATGSLAVGGGGLTNNNTTGAGFTANGTVDISGSVTNAGTLIANGATAVVNAAAGLTNSGSLTVNNAGGQVTISGGNFANSGTLSNAGTVTVQ
jgi:fibronectin-binding autotransporter adhesin